MTVGSGVRLPSVLRYDEGAHVLVLEDVGNVPTLKVWLSDSVPVAQCHSIGNLLGCFLAKVHNLHVKYPSIMDDFESNTTAKQLSALVYFGNLPARAANYGFNDDFITTAAEAAQREVLEAKEVLTLGDFWTGNVLVSPLMRPNAQSPGLQLFLVDLEFAKPGTIAFDIGQMAAEMYCLARYRNRERGQALLESFLQGYKLGKPNQIDVAKVAIRVGAHLVVIGPSAWGQQVGEQESQRLVEEGIKLIKAGWERDVDILRQSMLACLLE